MPKMVETIVYYSLQRVGSFGVVPSPINRRWEKEAAEREARQTVAITMGDLQIVVFVCCDDITDPEIYEQINFLKRAAIGFVPGFHNQTIPKIQPVRGLFSVSRKNTTRTRTMLHELTGASLRKSAGKSTVRRIPALDAKQRAIEPFLRRLAAAPQRVKNAFAKPTKIGL